jgi:hypothetical protein
MPSLWHLPRIASIFSFVHRAGLRRALISAASSAGWPNESPPDRVQDIETFFKPLVPRHDITSADNYARAPCAKCPDGYASISSLVKLSAVSLSAEASNAPVSEPTSLATFALSFLRNIFLVHHQLRPSPK